MSWFPNDLEECRGPGGPSELVMDDEAQTGVSIERGGVFRLGRRRLLEASGAAAALLAMGSSLHAQEEGRAEKARGGHGFGPISSKDLIAQAEKLALDLVKESEPNEEAYLHALASLLCRLDEKPGPRQEGDRPLSFESRHRSPSFSVLKITMAEGAAIPFHDHYEYNGVLLCLRGSVATRSFEMVDGDPRPPEGKPFLIRETVRTTLTPGRVSMLSRRRDNIHDLRAGKDGAELLDVFTYFPKREGSRGMDVDEKPVEPGGQVYKARWKPRRRRRR